MSFCFFGYVNVPKKKDLVRLGLLAGDGSLVKQLIDRSGAGVALAADVRLDNRGDLARRLDLPVATPDPELLVAAWLRWDEGCVDHLIGDFAFALWDPRRRVLFGARDHFGVRPFFFAQHDAGLIVAGDPAPILDQPGIDHGLDEEWIARQLCGEAHPPGATPYLTLHSLPPAHCLIWQAGRLQQRRYWQLGPSGVNRFPGSDAEVIAQARDLLARAVSDRLPATGLVGAELSGGIDSSALAATALPMLRARGDDLAVFSLVKDPAHPVAFPKRDEGAEVTAICDYLGIGRRFIAPGHGRGYLAPLDRTMTRHRLPLEKFSIFSEEIHAQAAGQGIRVMLSGMGGDHCFSSSAGFAPINLAKTGRWGELWRSFHTGGRSRRNVVMCFSAVLAQAYAPALWGAYRTRVDHLNRKDLFRVNFLANPSYAERHDLFARNAAVGGTAPRPGRQDQIIRTLGGPVLTPRFESTVLATRPLGLDYRFPLLDIRLVEFINSLPPQFRWRNGWGRWLARKVIEDRLPPSVAWVSKSLVGAPHAFVRLMADQPAILARIAEMRTRPATATRIDLDRLECMVAGVDAYGGGLPPLRHGAIVNALQLDLLLSL